MKKELNKVLSLIKENKLVEAKKICLDIQKLDPKNEEVYNIYAIVLFQLNDINEAIVNWKKSTEINPSYTHSYNNLGKALLKQNKIDEALFNFEKVIGINPKYFEAYYYKALILTNLNKFFDANEAWDKVISLKPNFVEGYIKRGHNFFDLKEFEKALMSYNAAYILDPDHPFLLGHLINTKLKISDWEDLDSNLEEVKKELIKFKKIMSPFLTLTCFNLPEIQKIAAEIWIKEHALNKDKIIDIPKRKIEKKIRVGYYSSEFHNHAVSLLISNMLELHDKSKFEIFCFYFGNKSSDKVQDRIRLSSDRFTNIKKMSDNEVIKLSRNFKIDIAIDLMTHSGNNNRFSIFMKKLAPIQVNFLGYPGTSGSNSIDYIIADKILIPKKNQKFYSEKVVYLPDTYQPNDSLKKISNKNFTKKELGLPEKGFIFCCFNAHQKITPKIFNIWMSLLKNKIDSVLWLLDDNISSQKNLKSYALERGVNPERIIFAKRFPLSEHLARQKLADLFIDTYPYTAHTTCSDALWVGLPVLTFIGETFASRVAASLLNALDLPELVMSSEKEYEETAIKFMNDLDYLSEIKEKIKKNKSKKPLFDTNLFTKNLEMSYIKMCERYENDKELDHIEIDN